MAGILHRNSHWNNGIAISTVIAIVGNFEGVDDKSPLIVSSDCHFCMYKLQDFTMAIPMAIRVASTIAIWDSHHRNYQLFIWLFTWLLLIYMATPAAHMAFPLMVSSLGSTAA